MDMLKRESNIILYLFLLFLLFCCDKKSKETSEERFVQIDLLKNFDKYRKIYQNINDSIKSWIRDSIAITKPIAFGKWRIDSLIVFNSDSTLLFTTINKETLMNSATLDNICELGGALVHSKWYFFFMGVSHVIPREGYQDSIYSPLSFKELSQISRENILSGAQLIMPDGTVKSNEIFFNTAFYNVIECDSSKDRRACFDSVVLNLTKAKYNYKLDKKDVADINRDIARSKRPPEPAIKKRSWWERYWHPFEPKQFGRKKEDDPLM